MVSPHTTLNSAKGWSPDVIGVPINQAVPDLLVRHVTQIGGKVEGDEPSLRVPFVADDDAHVVAEGTAIDEANPALSEVIVHTAKVAQLLRVSRELYAQSSTASLLSGSVSRAISNKSNLLLVRGDVDAGIDGLFDKAGITGGAVEDGLDVLIDAVAEIEGDGGEATHVLVSPSAWASLRKMRSATGSNENLLGAGTEDSERRILSLPVIVSAAVPEGSGLVLDKSAVVSAAGDVLVSTSENVYFAYDSIGVRATLRVGSVIAKTSRVASFTIAA